MLKTKKAQLETGQTMMVMIVFFILLIFSIIFYVKFQTREKAVKVQEFNEKEMVEKAQAVYSLGELSCSYDNVLKYDCIDILKLRAFKQKLQTDLTSYLYYRKLLGNVKIEVEELYPDPLAINYTKKNALFDAFENKPPFRYSARSIQIPVVLYNASDTTVGSYYFGLLTVTSYFKVMQR